MWFKMAEKTNAKYRLCDLSALAGVETFCFVVPQTKDFCQTTLRSSNET